jgi:adenylate cyclase
MLRFRKLKTKIHFFVLSFLTVILLLVLLMINRANMQNASEQILRDIRANGNIFLNAFEDSSAQLRVAARLLSSDYAFKQAYASHDHGTILSAMRNHLSRLQHADIMMALDIDSGEVLADTSEHYRVGAESPVAALLLQAEEDDYLEAVGFVVIRGVLYQFVVVPLMVPDPDAWIVIGFRIDDAYLQRFKGLSSSDVSLYVDRDSKRVFLASTLQKAVRNALVSWRATVGHDESQIARIADSHYLTLVRRLDDRGGVSVILQRSLDSVMRPYLRLQYSLLLVFAVAMVVAYFGSSLLARNISRPIRMLAQFASRVGDGEYTVQADVRTGDEIGELAVAFNHMTRGLEEREQMRNLLGKVVSPEIARQLIDNGVELGGEEKQVTILFSDLRNFTALCEGRGAGEVLALLNRYLNVMSGAVESHKGVVDKYIGDAIMALFGAPLSSQEDAENAVRSALQMKRILLQLNQEFQQHGLPLIDMGIGINTDTVVAGNMGSASRLNYTVIGDGVNLASRLEGLTKYYGVKILVSEGTVNLSPNISYREIDKVRVKGKREPVTIYEPYREGEDGDISAGLDEYRHALDAYREGHWQKALTLFEGLCSHYPQQHLYQVYLERCRLFVANPPGTGWDGAHTFTVK